MRRMSHYRCANHSGVDPSIQPECDGRTLAAQERSNSGVHPHVRPRTVLAVGDNSCGPPSVRSQRVSLNPRRKIPSIRFS